MSCNCIIFEQICPACKRPTDFHHQHFAHDKNLPCKNPTRTKLQVKKEDLSTFDSATMVAGSAKPSKIKPTASGILSNSKLGISEKLPKLLPFPPRTLRVGYHIPILQCPILIRGSRRLLRILKRLTVLDRTTTRAWSTGDSSLV